MITPDAKCVVNGSKVNEAIIALNPLLSMSVGYIGGGKPPQVTYSDGEVKILLPLADSVEGFSMEELDVVDSNNAASSRYFMTSLSSVSTYGTTTASTSGTPTGRQSSPQPTKGRNKLNAGGNSAGNNRDQLSTGGALRDTSGGGVAPNGIIGGGGALRDDGSTAADSRAKFLAERNRAAGGSANMISVGGTGVDEFGNTIGGTGGALRDNGQTAEQARKNFLEHKKRAASSPAPLPGAPPPNQPTTPPPTPGAPPLGGDTTPPPNQPTTSTQADASPVTQADDPVAKRWATYLESKEDLVYSLSRQLREAKKNDTQKWDASQNMWVFKKSGDPDSELVQALEARLEVAKAELKKAQSKA